MPASRRAHGRAAARRVIAISAASMVLGSIAFAVLLPAGAVGWLALVPVVGVGLLAFRWGSRSLPRTGLITTTGI